MKKYYLNDGINNIGPFDIDELKTQKITKNSPVWYEGLEEWTTAGEIEELKSILVSVPPPIKKRVTESEFSSEPIKSSKASANKEVTKKTNWFWRLIKIVVIILALLAVVIIIANINQDNDRDKPTYEESIMTIAETEAAYPTNYLDAGGTYKQNFLGDKLKINGFIQNSATVTTYKDVVIEIIYYSKTDTEIGRKSFTIYEFFEPNTKKPFNLKIDNYSNVKSIGWEVISANVKD